MEILQLSTVLSQNPPVLPMIDPRGAGLNGYFAIIHSIVAKPARTSNDRSAWGAGLNGDFAIIHSIIAKPARTSDDRSAWGAGLNGDFAIIHSIFAKPARTPHDRDELVDNPRPNGVVKLEDSDNGYRLRVGAYRVLYDIFDNVLFINVVRIGHRKEVYRDES
jgi:mRNA-degrading endonuclease RelE of RelBE toxin-antitoxin system